MKAHLVSVIIPTYNRGEYIVRAIQCVQNQSISDFEILVVDDGSKDHTEQIVDELHTTDPRIRWIKHSRNRGSQAARNTGIRAAQGEWIAFLDSDDEWLPRSLELRLVEAEKYSTKIVHSDCYIKYAGVQEPVLYGIRPLSGSIYKELLRRPGPVFPSLLLHADVLKEINYLDENIVSYQEWDTSIRLAKLYGFGFVKEPTFIYHRHTNETISSNPLRTAHGYEQIVQKHLADMDRLLNTRVLAYHYLKIAAYYFSGRRYPYTIKYVALALRKYLSIRHLQSLLK